MVPEAPHGVMVLVSLGQQVCGDSWWALRRLLRPGLWVLEPCCATPQAVMWKRVAQRPQMPSPNHGWPPCLGTWHRDCCMTGTCALAGSLCVICLFCVKLSTVPIPESVPQPLYLTHPNCLAKMCQKKQCPEGGPDPGKKP